MELGPKRNAASPSADHTDEIHGRQHPSLASLTLPERKSLCRKDLKLALLEMSAPGPLKN